MAVEQIYATLDQKGIQVTQELNAHTTQQLYDAATLMVDEDPSVLPEIIQWRWETELARGVIHFDPRIPENYLTRNMGPYMKRVIRDRMGPKPERMSNPYTPVQVPFETKFSGFDYSMAPPGQLLLSMQIRGGTYDIFAANSPLTEAPHTLLVPREARSQFLLQEDIEVLTEMQERYPGFKFMYSSMGGGAGVNQQHIHMSTAGEFFPILTALQSPYVEQDDIKAGIYFDWPTDSIVLSGDLSCRTQVATEFIQYLQAHDQPHNLFGSDNSIWINPRSRKITERIPGKKYGTWESILGICNACSWEEYYDTDEAVFEGALRDIQLDPDVRDQLLAELCVRMQG
jgi:hypothetical protein